MTETEAGAERTQEPEQVTPLPLLYSRTLAMAAVVVDDLERNRIANDNRIGVMTRTEPDEDGEVRGWGLDPKDPHVAHLRHLVDGLAELEKVAVRHLEAEMKAHPLGPWIQAQKGIGYKQGARLLAEIGGDPYINSATGEPRTVSALWAYCGLHVVDVPADDHPDQDTLPTTVVGRAARRRRGERANWSTIAKTRAYLVAASCLKQLRAPCTGAKGDQGAIHREGCQCSPYRIAYDRRRTRTGETHPEWTDGHRHTDALRYASKEILKALWLESQRIHEQMGDTRRPAKRTTIPDMTTPAEGI